MRAVPVWSQSPSPIPLRVIPLVHPAQIRGETKVKLTALVEAPGVEVRSFLFYKAGLDSLPSDHRNSTQEVSCD